MGSIFKSRPSPAIIVAVAALVAALAGTAIAGPSASTSAVTKSKVKKIANKQIDKRFPVGSENIADAAVTTPKLADAAVTTPKLADGTVTTPKLGNGSVTGPKLDGIVTRTTSVPLADGAGDATDVACQAGEQLIGGGGLVAGGSGNLDYVLQSSRPEPALGDAGIPNDGDAFTAWRVAGHNQAGGGGATTLHAFAVCLK
jgi:hypothetical protein